MILCQFFDKLRSCYFYGDKRAMYLFNIFVISIKSRPSFDLVIYISRYGSLHNYRTIKSENEIDETNQYLSSIDISQSDISRVRFGNNLSRYN